VRPAKYADYPQPEVGQTWVDNDPRNEGRRTLKVEAVEKDFFLGRTYATCVELTDWHGAPSARRKVSRINVDRMVPTGNGYRLQSPTGGAE